MTPAELLLTFPANPIHLARVAGVPVEVAERHLVLMRAYGWDDVLAQARAQVALEQAHHTMPQHFQEDLPCAA